MFQHGQHPVFSTQAIIHREVTPQLPEFHHKYLISQLSSQDWPPITDFGNWEESDVWNVCRVWIWSSSLTMTPQSSKINWLALGALLVVIQPPNSWQQWKSVLHAVISKLPCLPEFNYPLFTFICCEIFCFWAPKLKLSYFMETWCCLNPTNSFRVNFWNYHPSILRLFIHHYD